MREEMFQLAEYIAASSESSYGTDVADALRTLAECGPLDQVIEVQRYLKKWAKDHPHVI